MDTGRTVIVVPTYNERENVAALVPELLKVAPEADILLVDDDSPDKTADHAEKLFGANPRFSVLRRTGSRGYGRSLLDGDFSHAPHMVPALIDAARTADVAIGSRYCSGGRVANWPLHRRLLSRFANRYVRKITGIKVRDSTSGFRCYTRRALQTLLETATAAEGYAFLVETVFRAEGAGLRIVELPITFVDRREGQSKMSRQIIFESALKPWRLRFGINRALSKR
jgi:dolichol-phosphate mannosyltransferase